MFDSLETSRRRHRSITRLIKGLAAVVICYIGIAYLLLPAIWLNFIRPGSISIEVDRITTTSDGHPGDPLNVALVGTEAEVRTAMRAAGWFVADPLSIESDLRISADTVLKRVYDDAPVSSLFLYGRREDFAFEQPASDNPRHRHHVRFWQSPTSNDDGRPTWFGAASFDDRVGLSHTTGQITHHIAPDIDAERDYLMSCLDTTPYLQSSTRVPKFHAIREGRNGGGDIWKTDGNLSVAMLKAQ